jgi:UDP-galactopyranose mutase
MELISQAPRFRSLTRKGAYMPHTVEHLPTSASTEDGEPTAALLCFSHLRWDFVFQRPQHLMTRFAQRLDVTFWEEPVFSNDGANARLEMRRCEASGVRIATPILPEHLRGAETALLRKLLDDHVAGLDGKTLIRWYYTPMMLPMSRHLDADCVIYDCMDELANFLGAPPELLRLEHALIEQADLVFTGGYSLYEAKATRHPAVHAFPSSVDVAHFGRARRGCSEPFDQAALGGPKLGFYGVVDERMDLGLLAALADARPEWSIIILGPVVKISEADLPRRPNLHYMGPRAYDALPDYLSGWDVALMPFAINESTRFISPTKTPEYLAAGRMVVSTPITDVIRHYGESDVVLIAGGHDAFIAACDAALAMTSAPDEWRTKIDMLLADQSWDRTQQDMAGLIDAAVGEAQGVQPILSPTTWPAKPSMPYDVMVVGAGFAGSVMAERLAADGAKRVLVVDRRPHIAGNAYDRFDEHGVLIHQYGPHIFHTNSDEVVQYLSRFTKWHTYEHRVLADINGLLVPMPINRTTLNLLYDADLQSDEQAAAFLATRAEPVDVIRTSADVVISAVGRELYETFFQGYTRKQWGMDPSELDKSVTARVPTRTNTDDRYFTDKFQAMPADGYTRMFERILDHPNIDVLLGVDYSEARAAYPHRHLVFTGPIDEYFGHRFGRLPYRSLHFRHEHRKADRFQDVAVVNFPAEHVAHTRITEYKYLTGQTCRGTSLTYEYPSADGDPYYPIPCPENQELFKRYEALALAEQDVTFVGRLATYRYYNMDQIVGQALATYRKRFEKSQGSRQVAVAA